MLIKPGVRFQRQRFSQPLGLLYLISVLRQNFPGQFEIELIEQALYDLSFEQMRDRIKKFNPDLVGFSCLSMEADAVNKLSKIVKEIKPTCLTLLGGPHASVFYDKILQETAIDILIIGEGETTFIELIKKLIASKPIDDINGIAFKKENKIVITPPREPIEDLNNLPFPAWDMINFKQYSKVPGMNVYYKNIPWCAIFTSRGCPFRCAYCHNIFGKRTRFRSPENVIAEIELLTRKYGVKEIHIVDDIFNLDLPRAKKICDLIIEKGIKISIAFPNALRGDMMDKELIDKLKQAGCYCIAYAIETASPRIQKLINKNLNIDKVRQAINWTYEKKINAHGYFMIGFPSETKEEIKKTINWACNSKLIAAAFFSVVIYPRIPLMEIAQKTYPNFDFSQWKMFDLWYFAEKPFYTKVTGIDLFKIQFSAYRRFYLNPWRVFLILLRFPKNIFFIKGGFWALLRIISMSLYKIDKVLFYRKTP